MRTFILFLSFFLYPVGAVLAQTDGFRTGEDRVHPVLGRSGMVATQEAHATRVGLDILQRGGNAVDAAVAVGFALAATLPRAGNIGGGGFMMIYDAKSGRTIAIDYRETAPAAATRDMYLDTAGKVDKRAFRFSHKAIGIPGTVAGLTLALRKYGTMALKDVMAPALRLAGFWLATTWRGNWNGVRSAWRSPKRPAKSFSRMMIRRSRPVTAWCSATFGSRSRQSPKRAPTPSIAA
jgi:gamma-glutamyltranspeptidase / glutathione hydrolase